jgi:hypothetical protein
MTIAPAQHPNVPLAPLLPKGFSCETAWCMLARGKVIRREGRTWASR